MNVGIYNRVSTAKQLDNFSLDEQSRINHEYAQANGMTVVKEVTIDESASDLFRSGLDALLQLIERREIQALIVNSSDRLSRSTVDGLILLETLAESGVELHYATRGKVENTPEHRILNAVEFSMNEYWKFRMLQAMKRGRQGKYNDGLLIGHGVAPYGYRWEGQKRDIRLVINEEEAEVIRNIFHWYVVEDWGTWQICRELIARGVKTQWQKRFPEKKTRGWTRDNIAHILKNPTYKGTHLQDKESREVYYDPQQKKHRSRFIDRSQDAKPIDVPALVSEVVWTQAQEKIQDRSSNAANKGYTKDYMLARRLRCGICNDKLAAHTVIETRTKRAYRYYTCNEVDENFSKCKLPSARQEVVDDAAWNYVKQLMDKPEVVIEGFRQSQSGTQRANERTRKLIADTTNLLEKQSTELDNILAMRAESSTNRTSMRLMQMQKDTEKLIGELEDRLAELESQLIPEINIEEGAEQIRKFADVLKRGIANTEENMELKRQVAAYFQMEGYVTPTEEGMVLHLSCIIDPEGTDEVLYTKRNTLRCRGRGSGPGPS